MSHQNEKKEILKNPLVILKNEAVLGAFKELWANNHLNLEKPEKFAEDFFDYLQSNYTEVETADPKEILKYYKKKIKEHPVRMVSEDFLKNTHIELFRDDLARAETVLDFGCGKLAFLKNVALENRSIRKLIGVDFKSRPDLENIDPRIAFLPMESETKIPAADGSADLVFAKSVLHHIKSEEKILRILAEIKRVLKKGGKFVLFEESFPGGPDAEKIISESRAHLEKYGLVGADAATEDFFRLSREDKFDFLFLNDWLMNLQNTGYMPWTLQYKSMEDWIALTEQAGFRCAEKHFLGALRKRKRKQGMAGILVFIV